MAPKKHSQNVLHIYHRGLIKLILTTNSVKVVPLHKGGSTQDNFRPISHLYSTKL